MSLAAHGSARARLCRGGRSALPRCAGFFAAHGYSALRAGLRERGAKRRRAVALASLRSVPVHDGAELVEERQRRLAPRLGWLLGGKRHKSEARSLRGARGRKALNAN